MEIFREQNVATFFTVPLIDAASRPDYKASPTLAAGDVKVIRHTGGSWNVSNIGTLPSAITGATTQLIVTLTATEVNPDDTKYPVIIQFIDQTGAKEWDDQTVIVWTRPAVSNMKEINGDTQSATDLKDFADAGYDPATNKIEGVKLADALTTNNDKTGYSISGTKTTLDDLNDLAQSDILSDTTPFPGANIDAAISSRSTFDQTTDVVLANVKQFDDAAISESTNGRIAANFSTFFDNNDAASVKTQDDVGASVLVAPQQFSSTGETIVDGTVTGDYTDTAERNGQYVEIVHDGTGVGIDYELLFNVGSGNTIDDADIDLVVQANGNRGCRVEIYNYNTLGFDFFKFVGHTSGAIENIKIDGINSDYTDASGNARIRFTTLDMNSGQYVQVWFAAAFANVAGGEIPSAVEIAAEVERLQASIHGYESWEGPFLFRAEVETVNSQTELVLTNGFADDYDAPVLALRLKDQSVDGQKDIVLISSWDAATRTATLERAPIFTVVAGDFADQFIVYSAADILAINGEVDAANNLRDMYNGTGYVDDTAPASRSQVNNVGAASGGSINYAPVEDNTGGAIDPSGAVFVGSVVSGTFESVGPGINDSHSINDVGDDIDIVYGFQIGGNRLATSIVINADVDGGPDQVNVKVYDHVGATWDTLATVDDNNTFNLPIVAKHTGTGSESGKVYVRFETDATTPANLETFECLVSAVLQYNSVGYSLGAIWVDTNGSNTGTEPFVDGTADNPVSTWDAAQTLSGLLGIRKFQMATGSAIVLDQDSSGYELGGESWSLDFNGQNCSTIVVRQAEVSGVAVSAFAPIFLYSCSITTATLPALLARGCALGSKGGTLTLSASSTYILDQCYSAIAGQGAPVVDFGAANADTSVSIRHYSGGVEIRNLGQLGTDTVSLEGWGQVKLASSCAGGSLSVRGNFKITDNSGGVVVINSEANYKTAVITEGVAQAATNNTITLENAASTDDGAYDPALIVITTGTGIGQCRLIYQYTGATRVAVVDRDWKINPDTTSRYRVIADPGREHINEGAAQGGTNNTITLNAAASNVDNAYEGQIVFLRSGTGADQARIVLSYNGTTKVATINQDWTTNPDSTTAYAMLPTGLSTVVAVDGTAVNSVDDFKADVSNLATQTSVDTIDTNVDAILADTSVITGADGAILATTQPNYAPAIAGDQMNLADDAITSEKYDESTAFPIVSQDSGATRVARTGTDGDTLETLSDQIDGVQNSIDGIQNNTRFVATVPSNMIVPDAGDRAYRLVVHFYNTDGQMEDPDNNEVAVVFQTVDGTSKTAFTDDSAGLTPATGSTNFPGKYQMVRLALGIYETYYQLPSTEVADQWVAEFELAENASNLSYARSTIVTVGAAAGTVTLADNATNKQIVAEGVLATPANKLATDASGRVDVGLIEGSDATDTIESSAASGVLATPANKLATDASGRTDVGNWAGAAVGVGGTSGLPAVDAQAISDSTVAADNVEANIGNLDAQISTRATQVSVDAIDTKIGTPVDLGDGATISDNFTSIAGESAGAATYDRTTDSLEALANTPSGGGDWSTSERSQIRGVLGIDGTKTSGAGGEIQDIDTKLGTPSVDISTDIAAVQTTTNNIETDTQDIQARIGTPVDLGDGATLSDGLTALGGASAGAATYDRTTDSQEALANSGGGGLTQQQVRDAMKLAPTGGAPAADSIDEKLDTAQSDLDTITGSDGVTLATAQPNYAPAQAGDEMNIADDAITAAKFDQATAHPVEQADAGATSIARTGGAGTDTLDSLSDQIDAAQSDLDTITGADGATLATSQPNYAPAQAGDEMNLANDAITAEKFDESTAYPLESADTGATQVARTGADGDTLETISDQIDGISGPNGVVLATSQPNYAPAVAGDEMGLLATTEDTIVDKVWDESAAAHTTPGTMGELQNSGGGSGGGVVLHSGTAQGAGTGFNQIQLDTGASSVDGIYDPSIIAITSGAGAGQCRTVIDYDGSSRMITVNRDWKEAVDGTSVFTILPANVELHVNEGKAAGSGVGNNQIVLNSEASSVDDAYVGQTIFLVSGTGQDQARIINGYVGATRTCTLNRDWDTLPNTSTGYLMLPFLVGETATDWSLAEKNQIRDALGVDGIKTAATGGQLQDIQTDVTGIATELADATYGLAAIRTAVDAVDTSVDGINTNVINIQNVLGTPSDISSGGATISGNLRVMADYNSGTTFDSTIHSLQAIREAQFSLSTNETAQLKAALGMDNSGVVPNGGELQVMHALIDDIKAVTDLIPDAGAMTSIAQEATLGVPTVDIATDIATAITEITGVRTEIDDATYGLSALRTAIDSVSTDVLAETVDGSADMQTALTHILAYCAGNISRVGTVYTYRNFDNTADIQVMTASSASRTRS